MRARVFVRVHIHMCVRGEGCERGVGCGGDEFGGRFIGRRGETSEDMKGVWHSDADGRGDA